jgi:hypothetical protein
MPLPRLSRLFAGFCAVISFSTVSAQSLPASVNLPQFYDFYNLQHMMLGNLSEQDCIRLDNDACLKFALRQLTNGTHTADRKTLWITAGTRIAEMMDAGLTIDPSIYETTPSKYSSSNRRPAVAAFARWHIAADVHIKFALAYNSSTPKFTQDQLSEWQNETSTGTSAHSAMVEVAALMPVKTGFIQPYLQASYKYIMQYDDTAINTTEIQHTSTTIQSGFRTIYSVHDRLHLSFNLYAERDILQHMRITQSHSHHTGIYHIHPHAMQALRFGVSTGGRIIIGENTELTMLVSRFTQPFGTETGTGAAIYYLLRL